MSANDKLIETLQKLVDGFAMDVGRVRAALADDKTPEAARRVLVGALNYVIDSWDMFPDHYQGLGVADDAVMLRLAAAAALATGAVHRGLQQLAGEMKAVRELLGDLTDGLEKLCALLPDREVKGRTASAILKDADVRALFEADLNRCLKKHQPGKIEPPPHGPDALITELRKMVKSSLQKGGLVK